MKILFIPLNRLVYLLVSLVFILLNSQQLYARAGGAGGGGSDDGPFDIISDIIDLFFLNPLLGIIAILAVVIIYTISRRNRKS